MKLNKSLSLFLSIVLVVCAVLPTFTLNVAASSNAEDLEKIESIKTAWKKAEYIKDSAFIPKALKYESEIVDTNIRPTYNATAEDIKNFGEYSFAATYDYTDSDIKESTEKLIKKNSSILLYALGDSDGSDNNFSKYPYEEIKDIYLNVISETAVTLQLRYRVTIYNPADGNRFWVTVPGPQIKVNPGELTKISGLAKSDGTKYADFKSRIEDFIANHDNMKDLEGLYPDSFYDLRLDIKSEVTEDFSLTVGSAFVEGKAQIPEKIEKSTDFETVLIGAEQILADPTYINKEALQTVVDSLEVNMASHAPISAYLTDAAGEHTKLDESVFDLSKQSMLTDRDTDTPVTFDTQGKTLDIVINNKSIVKLRKLKAIFSENNISQMKIYGSNTYDGVWTEGSRVFEYQNTAQDAETNIGTDFSAKPKEYQYVRFSVKGNGNTVSLTEIQCMCLNSEKNDRLRYCNLIADKPETLTVAEVDTTADICTVSYPSNNKFGDSIFQFGENTAAICDGDDDTVYDFLGSPSIPEDKNTSCCKMEYTPITLPTEKPANIPTYNLIFELDSPANIDNIKFVSGSNEEYFPTKLKFYIGDDFESVIERGTELKYFDNVPTDGVYEANFKPTNTSFVRIEIIENSPQIAEYYGYQILAVVSEIEINGTEATSVTAVDTEGNIVNSGDTTVYNLNLTANDVKSVTDRIVYGTATTLTAETDGTYKITGTGKHTVTVTFNDGSSVISTYNIVDLITEEFGDSTNKERDFYTYYSDENNLAKGIEPYIFITNATGNTTTRTKIAEQDIDTLSNGIFIDPKKGTSNDTDIYLGGFAFRKTNEVTTTNPDTGETTTTTLYNGDYYNGYKPYDGTDDTEFNFNRSVSDYDAYVDIIYDLGATADVDKVQHFTNVNALTLGVYSIYASADINTLFNSESLVLNYQNKTFRERGGQYGSQQHEFAKRSARFVAFRIYCPVTSSTGTSRMYYHCLRIRELAIYGTVTQDYVISSTGLETLSTAGTVSAPEGTESLLSDSNLTVSGCDSADKTINISEKLALHDSSYGTDTSHTDIKGFNFSNYDKKFSLYPFGYTYTKSNLKNGYTINRNDVYGNIKFTQSGDITTYLDFTYDLGNYCNVKQFEMYSVAGDYTSTSKTQAYRVYIGDDKNTLYDDKNLAAEYENYFNTSGQKITFSEPKIGKYLGVRILMGDADSSYNGTDSDSSCAKIAEIAAFGGKVTASCFTAPNSLDLLTQGVYLKNGVQNTSAYLFAEYKTPMKYSKTADPTKIVLDDGTVANVKSRSIYVSTKAVYNKLVAAGNEDDFGKTNLSGVITITTTDSKQLAKYWRRGKVDENGYTMTRYGVCISGIKSTVKDNAFAVRGKLVYTVGDKEFTAYTNIRTADYFSAQGAYDVLESQGNQPSTWFSTGNDDGSINGDDFFG